MNCPKCGEVYKKAPLMCLKCNSILAGSLHLNKKTVAATKPLSQGDNLFENLKKFVKDSPDDSNMPKQSAKNSPQSIRGFAKYYPSNDHPSVETEEKIQHRVTHPTSPIQRLDRTAVAVRQPSSKETTIENNHPDDVVVADELSTSDDGSEVGLNRQPKTKTLDKNQKLNVIVISAYVITIILFLIYLFRNTSG